MSITARQEIITAAEAAGFEVVDAGGYDAAPIRIIFDGDSDLRVNFDRSARVVGGTHVSPTDYGTDRPARHITGTDRRGQVLAFIKQHADRSDAAVKADPVTSRWMTGDRVRRVADGRPGTVIRTGYSEGRPGAYVRLDGDADLTPWWGLDGAWGAEDAREWTEAAVARHAAEQIEHDAFADVEASTEAADAFQQGGVSGLAQLDARRAGVPDRADLTRIADGLAHADAQPVTDRAFCRHCGTERPKGCAHTRAAEKTQPAMPAPLTNAQRIARREQRHLNWATPDPLTDHQLMKLGRIYNAIGVRYYLEYLVDMDRISALSLYRRAAEITGRVDTTVSAAEVVAQYAIGLAELDEGRNADQAARTVLDNTTAMPTRAQVGAEGGALAGGRVDHPLRLTRLWTGWGTTYALDVWAPDPDGGSGWQRVCHFNAAELGALGRLVRAELGDVVTGPSAPRLTPHLDALLASVRGTFGGTR